MVLSYSTGFILFALGWFRRRYRHYVHILQGSLEAFGLFMHLLFFVCSIFEPLDGQPLDGRSGIAFCSTDHAASSQAASIPTVLVKVLVGTGRSAGGKYISSERLAHVLMGSSIAHFFELNIPSRPKGSYLACGRFLKSCDIVIFCALRCRERRVD